jgi:hypothetical protein
MSITAGSLPVGLSYTLSGDTITVSGTPYGNILPTSCGYGSDWSCWTLSSTFVDYGFAITVVGTDGSTHYIVKNVRDWALAPWPWDAAVAKVTSTSSDPSCGGNCDVTNLFVGAGRINLTNVNAGTTPGKDFVNLAPGESITIWYQMDVAVAGINLGMPCNLNLTGSTDYLVETTLDGMNWTALEPGTWWGSDRDVPAPGHVLFSQAACSNPQMYAWFWNEELAGASFAEPDYLTAPYDHTDNYLEYGQIGYGLRVTRVGGDMPWWPVNDFLALPGGFFAQALNYSK